MHTATAFPVKKAFLYSLIGSVVLSALLGIFAILSGHFGWLEIRIILTTVTIAIASICGLACGAYLGTRAGRALPTIGLMITFVAAVLIILGMWTEQPSETYWKFTAALCVFAVACSHLSLLSMARLADWFQWSLVAAYLIIFGVASLISAMMFFEIDKMSMFRLLGVGTIIDAAITVLIPIFHRLSKKELLLTGDPSEIQRIDAEIEALQQQIAQLQSRKLALGRHLSTLKARE